MPLPGPNAVSNSKIASMHSLPARATQRGGVRRGGMWKFAGLRARKRAAQRRRDRRPAGHGLDGPGEGQQVAPQAVGQEQIGRRRRVLRLQGRGESRKPGFSAGLRRQAGAILDQGHR